VICRHYFQTTIVSDEEARTLTQKAISQENKILSFLEKQGSIGTSAENIQESGILSPRTPITSIRRALTNLVFSGKAIRIGEVEGRYGQPIGLYVAVV
jgi:hypothetical protein